MRIRMLTPEDKDFTGAPVGGMHFNAVTGSDLRNDGSAADRALKSADLLPATRAAGAAVYLRRGDRQIIRRREPQAAENSVVWTCAASGADGNPARVEAWGTGAKPMIAGDLLSSTCLTVPYGAVTEGHGSSDGVQGRMPAWCSLWHAHYIGADMLTYAFWSPNAPGSNPSWTGAGSPNPGAIADMDRWEFAPNFIGAEGIFAGTSAYTQAALADAEVTMATTASASTGATVLTFASTATVDVNMSLSEHDSFQAGTQIVSKTSTTVTINKALIGDIASGASIKFSGRWAATNFDAGKLLRFKVLSAAALDDLTNGSVAQIVQFTHCETVVQVAHPALAVRYGAAGPLGAWLRLLCNGQANRYLRIVAWDFATSTITATTGVYWSPSGGPHFPQQANDTSAWAIVGHPRDRREGQFAQLPAAMTGANERTQYASAEAAAKEIWVVPGAWMRGTWTVANRPGVLQLSGTRLDMDGVELGRKAGTNTASTPIGILNPTTISNCVWNDIGFAQCLDKSEDSVVYGDGTLSGVVVTNVHFRETPQSGGWRCSMTRASGVGKIDGLTTEEMGRTALLLRADGAGFEVSNMEVHGLTTTHGNVDSTYGLSKDIVIEKGWNTNSARGSTSQVEGTLPGGFWPRAITRRNSIYSAPRRIGTSPGAGYEGLDNVSYDSAFGGCLMDRLFVPTAESAGIRIGPSADAPGVSRQNDNGRIQRSYISGLSLLAVAAGPVASGAAVEVRDTLITKGSAITGAATNTRSAVDADEASEGGLSLAAWEYMSRTDPFNPGAPTYQAFQIGSDRLDWQVPAYVPGAEAANCGTPVDLMVSRAWYRFGHMAGKAVATLGRMRPGSNGNTANVNGNFWLVPGAGDNASFILDTGYVVPVVRLTAAFYTLVVREQTLGGEVRTTTIVLEGRR